MMTEAQKRADAKYKLKAYDRLCIRVKKGRLTEYKALADAGGESLAGMIVRLLDAEMERRGR